MTGITAETVADSVSPAGHRLTTQVIRFPRDIADEVLTHRQAARNARSSRATPVNYLIDQALTDPYIPVKWQRANKGMQGGGELTHDAADRARDAWLDARDSVVRQAQVLLDLGLHKTVPNRLLESFTYQTMIFSATDAGWRNFFEQRCSDQADPPMQVLADAMRAAYDASTPREVGLGGWHLPFIDADERRGWDLDLATLARVSAARCARVSNLTFDGRKSIAEDLRLYDKLTTAEPPHHSPLEHPARAAGVLDRPSGCFHGWWQLRHMESWR